MKKMHVVCTILKVCCIALTCTPLTTLSEGKLVGAAVIPHGDFALAPQLLPAGSLARQAAERVHRNALDVAKDVRSLDPHVVVLVTPHGQAATNDYVVYMNSRASGFAELGQDLHNKSLPSWKVEVSGAVNVNISRTLLGSKVCQGACTGLTSFEDSEPQTLRWGEVIPLSILKGSKETLSYEIVLISVPSRRHNSTAKMFHDLVAFGRGLGQLLDSLPERIVLVMSCDLAHTHLSSGPYGFSSTAKPFDLAVGRWARSPSSPVQLQVANKLVDRALSCGFPGIVMLYGALSRNNIWWKPSNYSLEAPTYYGMLTVLFRPFSTDSISLEQ